MRHSISIEIQRAGAIKVTPAQASQHQCSFVGQTDYFYEFRIGVTNPTLDQRGFLVDHNDIHSKIIDECQRQIPSCELMVQQLATCISETLDKMGVKHDYVFLRISSSPFTSDSQGMKAMLQINNSNPLMFAGQSKGLLQQALSGSENY